MQPQPYEEEAPCREKALVGSPDHLETTTELADFLREERGTLLQRILAPAASGDPAPGGFQMARCFSDLTDRVIAHLFKLSCLRSGVDPDALPITIIATGGYGRRELSPFSDIDITFVPLRDNDPRTDRVIREIFRQLMEIFMSRCSLEVGYAYRLLDDCGSLDHQTASGLLDARRIAGSDRLFIQFEDAYWLGFNAADFIFTKIHEREQILEKWGPSPRVMEPQLKEGPGGLRDLHTMVWLVQALRHLPAARVRGPRISEALVRDGKLTLEEAQQLSAARDRLLQVRNALHAVTGATRDTLVMTRQEEIAGLLGYVGLADRKSPIERFMADLYPHLAVVRRLAAQVIEQVQNGRLILGIGLDCKRKRLTPANGALAADDPAWLLWACELAQRYDLTFNNALKQTTLALTASRPPLADPADAAQIFTRILSQAGKVYPILQQMADLGVLGWFLPEFGRVLDLVPSDPAHDYTVGQHTLYVIWRLEQLLKVAPNEPEEVVEMRRILQEMPNPEQLMLATLLHDVGKADPGRPHSEVGEELAAQVCARLNWSREAAENVCFLVRHHLLMAETSRLRDLNLEETITEFTRKVDDVDRLNMLYLLTYADTRAVGEAIWTPVKGRFLRELWWRAGAMLSDEETPDNEDRALARARHRLLKDLTLQNLPEEEVTEQIQSMPAGYLLNQPPNRIALHIEFVRRVRAGEPVVDFLDERTATYTELTVCAFDDPMPGLLARIAEVLYHAGLVVHGAQVSTRVSPADRIALDVLWVDYRGRHLSPGKQKEVRAALSAALKGQPPPPPSMLAPKKRAPGAIQVRSVRNDLSGTLTVIETAGSDEQGALYGAARGLAALGWDIQSARVSTWQGEVRAVFYLSGIRSLAEAEVKQKLEQTLKEQPPTS